MRCLTHGIGFTLYPPGFTPYGRKPIAPVGPDGAIMVQHGDGHPFEGTYFDAAIDAQKGHLWPAESYVGNQESLYQTQRRQLEWIAMLFGLDEFIDERMRERIARILPVPGQTIHDNAVRFQKNSSSCISGDCICSVLNKIPLSSSIFERLAEAGADAGLWPRHLTWDQTTGSYRSFPFRRMRTRASPP